MRHLLLSPFFYLEFDRQRYDAEGNWLAYVFLPRNRMLNAELIRLGLARPLADGRNLRYLDLFHELAATCRTAPRPPLPPTEKQQGGAEAPPCTFPRSQAPSGTRAVPSTSRSQ